MVYLSRKRQFILRRIPVFAFFSILLFLGCSPTTDNSNIIIHFQTSTPILTQTPPRPPTETITPDPLTPTAFPPGPSPTQIPEIDFTWIFKKTRCNGEKVLETSVELTITGGLGPHKIYPVGPLTISRSSPQIQVTVSSATSSGEPSRTKTISLPDDLCKEIVESTLGPKEICHNGTDDDGDGLVDSADPDCPKLKEMCTNGVDDDGDGLVDSTDPDCPPPPEICNNGVDDDRDGLVDSADLDCPPPPEICNNGIDDDRDGLVDSADLDCPPPPETCSNGIDDDRDGLVDVADPDCQKGACNDGLDNDGDGLVDWPADPGCKNKPDNDENQ